MAAAEYLHLGLICWRECHWVCEDPLQAVRLIEEQTPPDEDGNGQQWWVQILDEDDKLFGKEVLVGGSRLDTRMPPLLALAYASVV